MLPSSEITVQEPGGEASTAPPPIPQHSVLSTQSSVGGRIMRAALLLMIGTILSRVLGLGREVVKADLFGGGADVSAFTIANHVSVIVYDLLIAGTVNAALVPVFSEYAADESRKSEFGRVVGTVLTIAGFFLLVSVVLLEIFAEPLVGFMGEGLNPEARQLAFVMTQWVLPGVFFLGLSGIVMAALYSLNRFVYPAFTSALYNVCIIAAALLLAGVLGVSSMVVGMVIGAIAMLALQTPGLRGIPIRLNLDWRHPAVLKIFALYLPIGLSVVISSIALIIDRNLASQTGQESIAAMAYATTLIQFALGMVSAAISLAALPSLSQHFSLGDSEAYKRTLSAGLRLVTVLVLPAAALLFALAGPTVALVFGHGQFTADDHARTVRALLLYTLGLPFGAIDMVLIFAFYARKNTITPVLIGIAAAGVYLTVAYSTVGWLGMEGLVLANSVQLTFHALVTGLLLWRALRGEGGLQGYGIGRTALKAAGAAVAAGLGGWVAWRGLSLVLADDSLLSEALVLGLPALLGGGLYVGLVWTMRLPEAQLVRDRVVARLRR